MSDTVTPNELKPGDVFKVPTGPMAGARVRVLRRPNVTRYGNYRVAVELMDASHITLDYKAVVAVEGAVDGGE